MNSGIQNRSVTVPDDIEPVRLDKYLASLEELGLSRSYIQNIITDGKVSIGGQVVEKKYKVKGGEIIDLVIPPPAKIDLIPEDIPLEIVFEDEHLAVVNKPPGMVVHPAPGNLKHTLVNALLYHFGEISSDKNDIRPGIIHRLDKDTSGLLLVAKNDKVAGKLRKMMADREIEKKYHAVVCGHLPEESGSINLPIGRSIKDRKKMTVTHLASREAITEYKVLEQFRYNDYLEVKLITGRTHQIRVHFSHHNHPVLGDGDYGGRSKWLKGIDPSVRNAGKEIVGSMDRQALHAKSLAFTHPITGEELLVDSELPKDFGQLLELLWDKYR